MKKEHSSSPKNGGPDRTRLESFMIAGRYVSRFFSLAMILYGAVFIFPEDRSEFRTVAKLANSKYGGY